MTTDKDTMPVAWPGLMPAEYYGNALAPPVKPHQRAQLLNPNWKYTPSDQTDVQRTWRKFGWLPTLK